jgi:hypothetical protein
MSQDTLALFETKQAIVAAICDDIKQHKQLPRETIRTRWETLRPRISKSLIEDLAQDALAARVSAALSSPQPREATTGVLIGTVPITRGAQEHRTITIPVQTMPWTGPTIVYPQILQDTHLEVANHEVKALLYFTKNDLLFHMTRLGAQRDGLTRHIDVLAKGIDLLTVHQKETLSDLPLDVLNEFAPLWEAAQGKRNKNGG